MAPPAKRRRVVDEAVQLAALRSDPFGRGPAVIGTGAHLEAARVRAESFEVVDIGLSELWGR